MVREIDAMGGAMGINADATGIQFRMLNKAKGPSVRAPRVQCDKKAYQFRVKAVLERAHNLVLKQATDSYILFDNVRDLAAHHDIHIRTTSRSIAHTTGTYD